MFRSTIEHALNRIWYGPGEPGYLLRALEKLYAFALRHHQRLELTRSATDLTGRPIVVVGNVTVGGTGKTPLILRLCELLKDAGFVPGVVSRGYGRRGGGLVLVDGTQDIRYAGDEPWLIRERAGVPVAVCTDRARAARALFARGVEVVLSDDGLQHLRLPRTLEICVVDGRRGFGNGHLLPAGPLRESRSRLKDIDTIVANATGGATLKCSRAVAMTLEAGTVIRLDGSERMSVSRWQRRTRGRDVLAVAGIGHPERFFALLRELGIEHRPRAFRDHHDYTARDFTGREGAIIIMTEKDAVKCRQLALADAWYLPVTARLPRAWEECFLERIRACLEAAGTTT